MAKTSGSLRTSSATQLTPFQASQKIRDVITEIDSNGHSQVQPFAIGKVDPEIKDYARQNGLELASDDIVMTADRIGHTIRPTKVKAGIDVPREHLAQFPMRRSDMEIYHDSSNGNYVYFDRERNEKFVLHPNYKMKINRKKESAVNYITASRTNPQEFTLAKFKRIK